MSVSSEEGAAGERAQPPQYEPLRAGLGALRGKSRAGESRRPPPIPVPRDGVPPGRMRKAQATSPPAGGRLPAAWPAVGSPVGQSVGEVRRGGAGRWRGAAGRASGRLSWVCLVVLVRVLFSCAQATAEQRADGPGAAPRQLRSGIDLASIFSREVRPQVKPPKRELALYVDLMEAALATARVELIRAQFILVIDRNPQVQVALLYWGDGEGTRHFIGASLVSTGRPGAYDHFLTPLGVFEHSVAYADFRAEGTWNDLGIRGYGVRGMRVFDFGWVIGERTWGDGGLSPMRLQLHSTDPDVLEARLGLPASKGCIRVSASLNQVVDKYGVLDADYEAALERGVPLWVLRKDRTPTPWSGRYLVVVESERARRPPWASLTYGDRKAGKPSSSTAY